MNYGRHIKKVWNSLFSFLSATAERRDLICVFTDLLKDVLPLLLVSWLADPEPLLEVGQAA